MKQFKVKGLYAGTEVIEAEKEVEARREFHDRHPGLDGTIFSVAEVPPLTDDE